MLSWSQSRRGGVGGVLTFNCSIPTNASGKITLKLDTEGRYHHVSVERVQEPFGGGSGKGAPGFPH
jgi:hypothetical protein